MTRSHLGVGIPDAITPPSSSARERMRCGNLECSSRRLALFKDRRRPIFEGRWGCTARCIARLVSTAVRREARNEGFPAAGGPHRHRMPLGLMMLELGWITPSQLNRARDLQTNTRAGRIGHWLIAGCGVDSALVTRALAMQWGCPVMTMEGFDERAMALALPRLLLAETYGIVPLRIAAGQRLTLGFGDCPDAAMAFAMERMSGMQVDMGIVDSAAWANGRERLSQCDCVPASLDVAEDIGSMERKLCSMVVGMQPRASRLVRVHEFYWLRMWLEEGSMSTREGGIPKTKEDVVDRIYVVGSGQ